MLSGPGYAGRAPKNAPRVSKTSLAAYMRGRKDTHARSRRDLLRALDEKEVEITELQARLRRVEATDTETLRLELAAVRAAAQDLNVGSVVLVDRVTQLVGEAADLKQALARKELELASLQIRCDAMESTMESKSNALTQLLMPHNLWPSAFTGWAEVPDHPAPRGSEEPSAGPARTPRSAGRSKPHRH